FMGGGYGVEFSPSGQYLYNGGLLQWDVSLPTITDVIASRVQLDTSQLIPYYSLQLANNGKIYCTSTGNFGQLDYHLGVINYPDNPGAAADFDPNGINLSPRISLYGLPSSVQSFNYTNIFISSQFFCSGSPTQFSIQTRGPGKLQNYLWDFGDPGSVNNTSSDSLPAHIYSAPGQYMVTLVGTIGTTVRRKTYVVNILPSPQVNVSPPSLQNICAGESINLQATAQQNLNYQWYSNGVLLPDDTLSNLQAATSGFYQVIVSDSVCSGASDSVEIIVHPQADAQITPQNPAPICTGQTITLSAGQSTGNNYTWLINRQLIPDAALPVYNAASAGNYQAIVSSNGFCADTSEITIVLENPAPVVTIQKDLPDKCTDATVLTATGADSYVWSTGASGATLSVLPAEAGIYSVTGQNPGGCTGSATAIVFSAECEKEISAPNVITPNNDGQNDFFEVADTNLEFDLQVFNRWGKVIFERKNYQKQQDWRADEVPDGLYFYLISITNGQRLKGWIEVIR
ncbi:MAG: PKD domain-containing protein, partial [Sphingobacteriales bacterium]